MVAAEKTARDLRGHGLKLTRQRRVILEALRATKAHPDAYALWAEVKAALPRVSLATVYRTLGVLARLGLVREVESSGPFGRFDGRLDPHGHITCTNCGRIADVELPDISEISAAAVVDGPFRVTGCRVELTGLCASCAGGSKRKNGARRQA